MSFAAILVSTALAAQPTVDVDWTGLALNQGAWSVRTHAPTCPETGTDVLAAAAVIYSRKGGLSSWGHASVRLWVCEEGRFRDLEYETYRLSKNEMGILAERYAGRPFVDDPDYLPSQRGALVYFRNDDPVDRGFYAQAQASNREIYELWLDLGPEERLALYTDLSQRHAEQLETMDALQPLQPLNGRYRGLGPNCTVPLRGLELRGHPVTPFAFWRQLHPVATRIVLHPSHRVARRLVRRGELERTTRKRPLFRWTTRLPTRTEDTLRPILADARPALVPGD